METTIPVLIGITGLIASFFTRAPRMQQLLAGLMGLLLIWSARPGFADADPVNMVLMVMAAPIVIGLLAGLLSPKTGQWIALAGTLIGLVLLHKKITYFGFEIDITAKIALLITLGGLIPLIATLKATLIKKWFQGDSESVSTAVSAIFAGLLVFFATFHAQYLGVLLVGSGWLAVSLGKRAGQLIALAVAMLSLGFLFMLLKTNAIDTSFLRGNFLMGLVLGAAAIVWGIAANKFSRLAWIFAFILPVLIVFAAVMMGKANENFGALPAYVGALLGSTLLLFTKKNPAVAVPLQGLLIGLSVIVLAQFSPKKMPEKKSRLAPTAQTPANGETPEEPDVLDITAIQLKPEMQGPWKSVTESSKVEFKLGPEGGVTTGAVNKFDVQLDINDKGEPTKLNVKLDAKSLTTFVEMRDKSVLGEGYLNTAKYPKMEYVSSTIRKENDRYFVTGEFTMLGVKQPLNLELKFAANGMEKNKQYLVMVGKTAVDRTRYGMPGDAKIGNVVEVTFEVEFRK